MANKTFILICFILVSCASCRKIPQCDECKVYATDSVTQSVQRAQENEIIYTNEAEFDQFVCMRAEGFEAFVDTYINGCRAWRRSSPRKNRSFWRQNQLQFQKKRHD